MTLVLFCSDDSRVPRGCLFLVGCEDGEALEVLRCHLLLIQDKHRLGFAC